MLFGVTKNLFHHFFCILIILFTKNMFAAIVYIRYQLLSLHRKAKIATLILTVDREATLQLIANYSYSHVCSLYFVCRSLCMSLCQLKCLVWRSYFWKEVKRLKTSMLQMTLPWSPHKVFCGFSYNELITAQPELEGWFRCCESNTHSLKHSE